MSEEMNDRDGVIRSLSPKARGALYALDVHLDAQLPGLDLAALEMPEEDAAKIRAAIAAMPPAKAPPDLAGLTGVVEGDIDLDEIEEGGGES